MIFDRILFTFLLISTIFSIIYALDLKVEELIGGYTARQQNFKYQAVILGKYNLTNGYKLLCSAGILSDYLLISSAGCVMFVHNQLKKFTFYALVGVDIVIGTNINAYEIDKIYTHYYFSSQYEIVISKLKESLNLGNRHDLAALDIPVPEDNFHTEIGIVASFGVSLTTDIVKRQNREQLPVTSRNGMLLKFAGVTMIDGNEFTQIYNQTRIRGTICRVAIRDFTDICGIIQPDETYEQRGTCTGDNGAPLVYGNKIVGVLKKHNKDCDDTVHGAIYTKVLKYREFIIALMQGTSLAGTEVHDNPIYVPYVNPRHIQ